MGKLNSNYRDRIIKIYIDFEKGLLLNDFLELLSGFNSLYEKVRYLTIKEIENDESIDYEDFKNFKEWYNNYDSNGIRNILNSPEPLAIKKFNEGSLWIELMSNPMVTHVLLPILGATAGVTVQEALRPKLVKIFGNKNLSVRFMNEFTDEYNNFNTVLKKKKIKKVSVTYEDGEKVEIKREKQE